MSEKKRPGLSPHYLKSFRCVGAACEDSCCAGWRVDIDRETWNKYRKIHREELAPLLAGTVKRNRSATKSEVYYAKVRLDREGACPFLSKEMLCRLQLEYGEAYLSTVCTTYPRSANILNGILERSATVSCPEAARIALLQPGPMEFDEEEVPAGTRNVVKNSINTQELKFANRAERHLWPLRIFTISVLQDRRHRLWERLLMLGIFCDRIQAAVKEEKANEIPALIAAHKSMLDDGSFRAVISGIPAQNTIQMELLKELADERYFSGVNNKRYLECFNEFLCGICYTADSTVEEIGKRYRDAWHDYYAPYMQEHEYILENYLVNYAFKNLFPFTGEKSLFDSYVMLALHYSMIKMHLIGIAGNRKGLTDELVVKLIQSLSKTIEHSQIYLDKIAELMKRNGFNTMAYMSILIRN